MVAPLFDELLLFPQVILSHGRAVVGIAGRGLLHQFEVAHVGKSRGIIGLNNAVLTASAGEAIMAHRFLEYQPWKGEIERRTNGSIIAMETGTAYAYALNNLQSRGRFFISPQEEVYAGQVVGEHTKDNDLVVNVTKSKKLTNMRASGSDDKVSLAPPTVFSLEDALEYIKGDEYVEITPNSMRMRKIILDELERKRQGR